MMDLTLKAVLQKEEKDIQVDLEVNWQCPGKLHKERLRKQKYTLHHRMTILT